MASKYINRRKQGAADKRKHITSIIPQKLDMIM